MERILSFRGCIELRLVKKDWLLWGWSHFWHPIIFWDVGSNQMINERAANVVVHLSTHHVMSLVIFVDPLEVSGIVESFEGARRQSD